MPRDASGNYTLPAGNPVVSGTTISSTVQNNTSSDIGTELTGSLSRNGFGGMLSQLKIIDGNAGSPGMGFLNELGTGVYRFGAGDLRISLQTADTAIFSTTAVSIGENIPTVSIGVGSTDCSVGSLAATARFGTSATTVELGDGSNDISIGTSRITVESANIGIGTTQQVTLRATSSEDVAVTVPSASGGLQVRNNLTGGPGLERVLTTSDLPSAPPAVAGYTPGEITYLNNDYGNSTSINISGSITKNTFETIGPTGSGATNIWTALDDLPANATGVMITVTSQVEANAASLTYEAPIRVRGTGSISAGNNTLISNAGGRVSAGGDLEKSTSVNSTFVVLDGNNTFELQWNDTNVTFNTSIMYLNGFITEK